MTTAKTPVGGVPEWTIGDRLRKARETADIGPTEMADRIGISRNSVANYEHGRTKPRTIVLNAWALATGVAREWLETGEAPASPTDTPGNGLRPTNPCLSDGSVTIGPWVTDRGSSAPADFHAA